MTKCTLVAIAAETLSSLHLQEFPNRIEEKNLKIFLPCQLYFCLLFAFLHSAINFDFRHSDAMHVSAITPKTLYSLHSRKFSNMIEEEIQKIAHLTHNFVFSFFHFFIQHRILNFDISTRCTSVLLQLSHRPPPSHRYYRVE